MKPDDAARDETAIERKIVTYSKIGIPVATIVGMLIAGKISGPPLAVLVLAAGALVGVITALWASLRALLGETPLTGADAYAIAAPRAEEEQKRAVLRALKDLEFERSVGKISDEDYRELVAHYRAEAKRLLRFLDDEAVPRRAQAEALFAKRLREEGLAEAGEASVGSGGDARFAIPEADEADAPPAADEVERRARKAAKKKRKKERERQRSEAESDGASEASPDASDGRACAGCGTTNDDDAVFCKKCGAKQESA
jgi:DNA-binding transcriptional ArsR family regulator